MPRKRLFWGLFALLIGSTVWLSFHAAHQSVLDHRLFLASGAGDPIMVRELLAQGANANTLEGSAPEATWQHFLNLLLRRKQDIDLDCPLNRALTFEMENPDPARFEIVSLLLEHGADPNITLPFQSPLIFRTVGDAPDDRLLLLFLQHGANPNRIDKAGASLLMNAVQEERSDRVQVLLEHGAKPNLTNADGDDALMWAAYHQDAKLLTLLLAHGAQCNHPNKIGETALTYCLMLLDKGQKEAIEVLLRAGADVNIPDQQGCTPFLQALLSHDFVLDRMMEHGADLHKAIPPSSPALQVFTVKIHTATSTHGSTISYSAVPGTTPLMFAAINQDVGLVKRMLAKGADINAHDTNGKTALALAGNHPRNPGIVAAGRSTSIGVEAEFLSTQY